jgi:hypothetical protein
VFENFVNLLNLLIGRNKQWGVIRGDIFVVTGEGYMSSRRCALVLEAR